MKVSIKKIAIRVLKITGIFIASVLALLFLLPLIFPKAINSKIDSWANSNINGHITFSGTRLSFFHHFPSLTLSLENVVLLGSAPFERDTLIASKEISLGIDLSSVFKQKIKINKIYLDHAFFNIQTDSLGRANYNIYKGQQQSASAPADTSGGASLGINLILITNSRLVYNDQSLPMTIKAEGFNYKGSGDLSKDVFELKTHTDIQSIDFYYAKQPYVIGKKVSADLVTLINTQSLTFIFQKNDLLINQLPVDFSGQFGFIKDGYDMHFNIDSHENDIEEILTALPADMQKMLTKTKISGTGNIQMGLNGKFIAKDSIMPDLTFNFKVRDGFISNDQTPAPVEHLYLDLSARLPGLNPDSMTFNIDSLYFKVADGYLSSVFKVKGVKEPWVYAWVHSEIDLEKWHRALGVKPFDVKGQFALQMQAEGRYARRVVTKGMRKKPDTVITSIPKFVLRSTFRNGYFKYASVPEPVRDIRFNLRADCADNNYKNINIAVDSLNASALNDYIKGYFRMTSGDGFPMDASLQARLLLEDVQKFYPLDSLDLKGELKAVMTAKGKYLPEKKKYPVVAANITLDHGLVQTKYYPHPIENITVSTQITDKTGDLAGLNVQIKPITFLFEKQLFTLKADLNNFNDLDYKVNLKGDLDIGRIYQVFSQKGYNVTGTVSADLSLKGKQSDAVAGRYDKLNNKGSLTIKNVTATTEMYPEPFVISRGVFSFRNDKMQFDTFAVKYAHSMFFLNGTVSNVLDYVLKPGSVLKGDLSLNSDLLVVDDFMAFSKTAPATTANAPGRPASQPGAPGVVLVPKNLDLHFTANVKQVKYTDLVLTDARGDVSVDSGNIVLQNTGFTIIDAPVTMDARYSSVTPMKAKFDYQITAKDFDIHKAYTNIKIFHDMASSAAHAGGLVSLDYRLSGYLNDQMMPVYPSLKGGGVLTAKKIRMNGFKLFNAIGKEAHQDSLGNDRDLSKVELKTTIANNLIHIERTKLKMAGFRVKFEGQVSFSNELNLKFRLGLPPLGLIGIPMTITGTEDKPKIHLGKGSKNDELAETADTLDKE